MKKGKDAIDKFQYFFLLKSDAMFCNFFIKKFHLELHRDNTPAWLKSAKVEEKVKYLHSLVAEALRELLPYFKDSEVVESQLDDFPLAEGRKREPARWEKSRPVNALLTAEQIDSRLAEATAEQIDSRPVEATAEQIDSRPVEATADRMTLLKRYMVQISSVASSSRKRKEYCCTICSYKSKYESICLSHIENCLRESEKSSDSHDSARYPRIGTGGLHD